MAQHPETRDPAPSIAAGHELSDVAIRPVAIAAAAIVLLTAASFGGMWWLAREYAETRALESPPANPLAAAYVPKEPPAPRLQTHPRRELLALRADADARLSSWGWVDATRGIAHIPIDRAITLLAERGLPARPAPQGSSRPTDAPEAR